MSIEPRFCGVKAYHAEELEKQLLDMKRQLDERAESAAEVQSLKRQLLDLECLLGETQVLVCIFDDQTSWRCTKLF